MTEGEVRSIITIGTPEFLSLKNKCLPYSFESPPPGMNPIWMAHTLAKSLLSASGAGLAAPQIGIPYRVCAIRTDKIICMFNPKIVDYSEQETDLEEGCLSLPGLVLKIKRPGIIRIRYTDPSGETHTEKYTGLTARVMQHEVDHLDGILITDKVSKLKVDLAMRKARKHDSRA